jgi:hypothetical protein
MANASGSNDNPTTNTVDAAVEAHCQGRDHATYHEITCTVMVRAKSVGRIGPSTVLNPAHPILMAFNNNCKAQHDDDNSPNKDHQAYRYAVAIIQSLMRK